MEAIKKKLRTLKEEKENVVDELEDKKKEIKDAENKYEAVSFYCFSFLWGLSCKIISIG